MSGACHAKRGGITPMMVRGVSPMVTIWPRTSLRPPNFSTHAPWSSTTTGAAPGLASSSVNTRPLSGGTPRDGNVFGVISVTETMSEPEAERMTALSVALTTTASNTVCCSSRSSDSSCPIAPP